MRIFVVESPPYWSSSSFFFPSVAGVIVESVCSSDLCVGTSLPPVARSFHMQLIYLSQYFGSGEVLSFSGKVSEALERKPMLDYAACDPRRHQQHHP